MLRARVYTENYIGVHVYENYGTIVSGSYVYRLAIVQRSFNDCSTIVKLRRNVNFHMTDTVRLFMITICFVISNIQTWRTIFGDTPCMD